MLINDLKYFKHNSNYHKKYSGIDNPNKIISSITDFNQYPIQDFDYKFNSWAFRGPEYEQYVGQAVNICLGDSYTVNLGGPVEHSWCSELSKNFSIPTINLGMDGAGNDAMQLVYDRACEVFDVKNTFIMYSYLHRRLENGEFIQTGEYDRTNFDYFQNHRIHNAIECALPGWCWSESEKTFLNNENIYYFNCPHTGNFADFQNCDRQYVDKNSYENLAGPDWPKLADFINGAEPHPDMFTKQFGQFISRRIYVNRDGVHLNYITNKIYADYLYSKWSQDG